MIKLPKTEQNRRVALRCAELGLTVDHYKALYRKGRVVSQTIGEITAAADALPMARHHAWMDGYMDHAVDREMWEISTKYTTKENVS